LETFSSFWRTPASHRRRWTSVSFGDCFSYALAKSLGEPLLFKGNDFSHTDVVPALAP
jgi:ribonuclease VapC